MSVTDSAFLYQTQLGGIATVSVTHNAGYMQHAYAGNLGLHVDDDALTVQARRAALEQNLGSRIQWLNQVHGTTVHTVESYSKYNSAVNAAVPTADAAITSLPSIALAIMTADCLPVMFSAHNDHGQHALGAAHAGWRGLLNGVLEQTVIALKLQIPNATIDAHLGPCIGAGQFEVGHEVYAAFVAKDIQYLQHFTVKSASSGKFLCDLESLARHTLRNCGVLTVSGGGWCTVSDPRLASYRRNCVTGRFATLVVLNQASEH